MDLLEIFEKAGTAFFFMGLIISIYAYAQVHDWKIAYMGTPDAPDTALSVKVVSEHGLTGKVPELQGGAYYFLGSVPPLYAVIGGMLNWIVNDPVASCIILNLAISIAIMALILDRHKEADIRLKIILFFAIMVNAAAGDALPLVIRARSLLAALFFMLLLYLDRKGRSNAKTDFVLMLGCFASQPIIGIFGSAILIWRNLIRGEDKKRIIAIFCAFGLSAVLQYKLIFSHFEKPDIIGGSVFSLQDGGVLIPLILGLAAFLISLKNSEKKEALAALALLAIPIINTISFNLTGDIEKTLFVNIPFGSDLVYPPFLLTAFVFLLFEYGESIGSNRIAVGIMFFLIGLVTIQTAYSIGSSEYIYYEKMKIVDIFPEKDTGKVVAIMIADSPGKWNMVHGDFMIASMAILAGKHIVFAGAAIPPQLDKGPLFQSTLDLANDLTFNNGGKCAEIVREIREENVSDVAYLLVRANPGYVDRMAGNGEACGLIPKKVEGAFNSSVVAYSIRG